MRHLVKGRKLGRTASHRKATLAALAIALIHDRRITTTVAKAKELRGYIEPLITRAKVDNNHNRRRVFSKLQDKYAVKELFEEVGPRAKDRPGGYTRVLKIGSRPGDAAEMALIELVDYNDTPPEIPETKKKRTRRAGRSKKTTAAQVTETASTETDTSGQGSANEPEETATATPEKVEEETQQPEGATSDAAQESAVETSSDFNVDEVKGKLEDMSLEEARAFVGNDERVTVQKALQKKIDNTEE